jgi:RNA recognition motif-containing protein
MSMKLFVGNLAAETTHSQLQDLFSTAGAVESCRVIMDRATGVSKGFAFIEMTSADAAHTAIEKFNGQELQGKALKVNEARPKV